LAASAQAHEEEWRENRIRQWERDVEYTHREYGFTVIIYDVDNNNADYDDDDDDVLWLSISY
jgi:hypothetical protein